MSERENTIEKLESEIQDLRDELHAVRQSPFMQSTVASMVYEVVIDREEIVKKELGQRINEKLGTMFEIKNQAKRFAHLLGLDPDMVRLMATEALQNIIEHGYGKYATVRFEMRNDVVNPCLISTFKHEIAPGERYTMKDINFNALKADIESPHFDFESSRGRGEFIMKQLTNERRIINGIEMDQDGRKIHYFKRILINYKNPAGPRQRVTFREIKDEIDRLDYEDVVCCFHVDYKLDKPDMVTIACVKDNLPRLTELLTHHGFEFLEQEGYFRTAFCTFRVPRDTSYEELLGMFSQVRSIVYREQEGAENGESGQAANQAGA